MPTLIGMIAKRFIATPAYYAVQSNTGSWRPSYAWNPDTQHYDGALQPMTPKVIEDHLEGRSTFGHYLVNRDKQTKLFCFDLDLVNHDAPWLRYPGAQDMASLEEKFGDNQDRLTEAWEHLLRLGRRDGNPRELWQDKKHPSRPYYLRQMRGLAELLSQRIRSELDIPLICEYSGFKGLHIYGLTGPIGAGEARTLALAVLDSFERFEPVRGDSVFRDTEEDPEIGFPTIEIEVFPKQDEVKSDGFGNLLSLPLGRNRKNPGVKKFFLDQRAPHATIAPHPDPYRLLETGDPWND